VSTGFQNGTGAATNGHTTNGIDGHT